jgi:hypothetical protein
MLISVFKILSQQILIKRKQKWKVRNGKEKDFGETNLKHLLDCWGS